MSIESRSRQYGTVFGHWQIREKLGSGSGEKTAVFSLVHSTSTKEFESALKVVNLIEKKGNYKTLSDSQKAEYSRNCKKYSEKAEREVVVMEEFQGNSHIVDYKDHVFVEWVDETSYGYDMLIQMEKLTDLRKEMERRGCISETEIIKIGKDICEALMLCHSKGIYHRDIKPENIFVNKLGDYKLGDFGIAKILSVIPMSAYSTNAMTPQYAAPEQFRGEYDQRTDIYSLGLVLYELSNGNRLPFAESQFITEEETMRRVRGNKLPALSNVSSELEQAITKACSHDPDKRYQTAKEFLRALNISSGGYRAEKQKKTSGGYDTEIPTKHVKMGKNYSTEPANGTGRKWNNSTEPVKPKSVVINDPKNPNIPKWLQIAAVVMAAIIVMAISWNYVFEKESWGNKGMSESSIPEEELSPEDRVYENVVVHCQMLEENGDYVEVVQYLKECREQNKDDTRYALLLSEYEMLLKNSILETAANNASNNQYRQAIQKLDEAWEEYGYQEFFDGAAEYRQAFGTYNTSCFAAGKYNTMLIRSNGTVEVVGDEANGELDANGWTDIIAVSAGDRHVVGLKSNGTVLAEGEDRYGQCSVEEWRNVTAISAGDVHTVVLMEDGTVDATGFNNQKQCNVEKLMSAAGEKKIVSVATGYHHTLALLEDGSVVACGSESVYKGCCDVFDWSGIVSIYAGTSYSAGLKSDGTVVVTGRNKAGENVRSIWDISEWTDIVNLSAGDYYLVGLKSDGTVLTAGLTDQDVLNDIATWRNIVHISAGHNHIVALTVNGKILCAGGDDYGQCAFYGTTIQYPSE